jgi:hypothetical protein
MEAGVPFALFDVKELNIQLAGRRMIQLTARESIGEGTFEKRKLRSLNEDMQRTARTTPARWAAASQACMTRLDGGEDR